MRPIVYAAILVILLVPVSAVAAPRILYTDIVSGPNTGGEAGLGAYLTIFGNGFGTSGTVTINNVAVASVKQWTDAKITVQPGPAVTSGAIKIRSGGSDSNIDHLFSVTAGDIFFVALTGNDSSCVAGDITRPCRNIQNTFNRTDFGAGDHLVVRGGDWSDVYATYGSFFSVADKSGTPSAPIVIMGYPTETVNLLASTHTRGIHSWNTSGHYVIANFHLDARGQGLSIGLTPGTSNVRVVNNEVKNFWENSGGAAAIDGSGKQYRIFGNHVHDNGGSKLYHALYFDSRDTSGPDDIEIAYNHIHHQAGGRGIQIYGDTGTAIRNVRIHHNLIHDIALDGILFARDTTTGLKAYNNIIYRTADPSMRGATNDEGTSGGCIRFANAATEAEVYNNTFVDCNLDGDVDSGAFRFENAARVIVQNNIVVSSKYFNGTPPSNRTISNNLWYGGGTAPSWDTRATTTDPQFLDQALKNYRLQATSPAIDAGLSLTSIVTNDYDGNTRPQGTGYDIGAFESAGATPSRPRPPTLTVQ